MFFYCFEFYNELLVYEEIEGQASSKCDIAVPDRNRDLAFDFHSAKGQFMKEACFINTFEESGAERAVNLIGSIDDLLSKLLKFW